MSQSVRSKRNSITYLKKALSRQNVGETLLYLGIYITIFLFSCGLVGYGIENYPSPPCAILEPRLVSPKSDWEMHVYIGAMWILGIFGMIAGLLGIIDVIEVSFIPILFRRKHSMQLHTK